MNRYEAHVTDEWQTDTMVVQVRRLASNDTTQAIAQVLEDRDGMPVVRFHDMTLNQAEGKEHLVPTPGLRIPHDAAVAMARAILTEAGKDADEVERLKAQVAELQANLQATLANERALATKSMALEDQVAALERLVEAKDAHLEREARTSTVFMRGLEMGQTRAEYDQAVEMHPARTVETPTSIQDSINQATRKIRDAMRAGGFPQSTED